MTSFFRTTLACGALVFGGSALALGAEPAAPFLSAASYPSIQAAIDANPGRTIYVPEGDYVVTQKVRLGERGGGLWGPGRIVQSNPAQPILEVEHARGASVRGLTLTRAAGQEESTQEGLVAAECRDLLIEEVQVLENRSAAPSIAVRDCAQVRVLNCRVRNYMRISVDDRTASPNYGYAFKCIDGTGIGVTRTPDVRVEGNRVVEERLLPTREVQQQFQLGRFTKKNATKGLLLQQRVWEAEEVSNWHQGSAIVVTGPEITSGVQILNNSVENAAQGVDIHADHVVMQGNVIRDAFIGMKAMHGSRHVIIMGNQFVRNDLWSIGLMPGAGAHAASAAGEGTPARVANVDGGSIIANNIISEFGQGHAAWIWAGQGTPMRFDEGQEPDDPPLQDVVVTGNVIYNSARDAAGDAAAQEPRYEYAVRLARSAKNIRFLGNVFHAGRKGVANGVLEEGEAK